MNILVKIVLRPVVKAIIALLEKTQTQIREGRTEEALVTIEELKESIQSAANHFLS